VTEEMIRQYEAPDSIATDYTSGMGKRSKHHIRNPRRRTLVGYSRFVLLDANVVAGYYLPESLDWKRARPRIKELIDSVRAEASPEVFLYIPSICIAEVFGVFHKYTHAT
jgi:hypothetical protein